MTRPLQVIGGVVLAAIVIVALNSFFVVTEREQAIVLQLGAPVDVNNDGDKEQAGLHFKLPFVQNVVLYDKRNKGLDSPTQEIVTSDQERLEVQTFVRWKIQNPLIFYQRLETEPRGADRLLTITTGVVREALGEVAQSDIVSGQRGAVMANIAERLNREADDFGIQVVDVRIRRADLPQANSERVFNRMRSERQQAATQIRAQGEEAAERIRAEADRIRTVTLAEANEQSEIIRGEGDGQRNAIYADAFNRDPEFFSFYRSLQAYERSIQQGTPLVLSPDSDFFRYFGDQNGNPDRQ